MRLGTLAKASDPGSAVLELGEDVTVAYEPDRMLWRTGSSCETGSGRCTSQPRCGKWPTPRSEKAVHPRDNPADLINLALEELVRVDVRTPLHNRHSCS
jgi:hypothetical protein